MNVSRCALLIPCRNGAPFLERLFASAAAQTRPFEEIWLFDDGSTDGSAELADRLGARVLRSECSLGPGAGRNLLARHCACDWIHFHDADDVMSPDYLEASLTAAQASPRPSPDLVICDMLWLRESDGAFDSRWSYDARELERNPVAYMIRNTLGGINGLYRRESFLEAGGFEEGLRFWEDMELAMRLFRRGAKAVVVNRDLVTAYRRAASFSNSNLGEVWRVKAALLERLLPTNDPLLLATIAVEAEDIACRQAELGLWADVPASLALARRAGGDPPTTRSRLLRSLKLFLPPGLSFRLQHSLRKRRGIP